MAGPGRSPGHHRRDLMAPRRTESRSKRSEPPDLGFAPADADFDFSPAERAARPPRPSPVPAPRPARVRSEADGAPGDGAAAPDPAPARGHRASRLTREPPAAPAPPSAPGTDRNGAGNGRPPGATFPPPPPAAPTLPPRRGGPQLKKLRIFLVLVGIGLLAMVSAVFGMMMAVSQDLPAIENFAQFKASKNSIVRDDTGEFIGTLSSNQNKILLDSGDISQHVKSAVVAIEDSRFYDHRGVDFQGIARAVIQDVLSRSAKQGASTITQQFVKNALEAQGDRTVFQKLREAALAYHLERKWSKDKILTEYLNTVYFGEGAYGIESAARTYFGSRHPTCGTTASPCASVLTPAEAALLAGSIASPGTYDPATDPTAAQERRDLVLQKMFEQGYITDEEYRDGLREALPSKDQIERPTLDSEAPYFTSWLRQQLVDRYGPQKAFFGGLTVHTTLDLSLQRAAEDAVYSYLGGLGPTASVVVIDNRNGGIKAMVGGPDFEEKPFNLATQGRRQPGSSIKPFILVEALRQGIPPTNVYESAPQLFSFGKQGREKFPVENYEDQYLGSASIATATTYSDNSVYAQIGLESIDGTTHAIARTTHKMGVWTPLSTNPAMVLGGLEEGVTPLEWAYAFSTLARDGNKVWGTLSPEPGRPVAFTEVTDEDGDTIKGGENDRRYDQVIPEDVAVEAKAILQTVVSSGTGTNADIGDSEAWGKTGTTENNGDAWFCGAVETVTACVWVGYADSTTPMETEYLGGPVDGGTYPALIWASVISAWQDIEAAREAEEEEEDEEATETESSEVAPTYSAPPTETSVAPGSGAATEADAGSEPSAPEAPPEEAPAPTAAPATPPPAPPAGGGSTGSTGGASPGG
jgi:penicillin-binding protein 1A